MKKSAFKKSAKKPAQLPEAPESTEQQEATASSYVEDSFVELARFDQLNGYLGDDAHAEDSFFDLMGHLRRSVSFCEIAVNMFGAERPSHTTINDLQQDSHLIYLCANVYMAGMMHAAKKGIDR